MIEPRPSRSGALSGLRAFFVAVATGGALILVGNPLASTLGLAHWSPQTDDLRKIHFFTTSDHDLDVLLLGSSKMKYDVVALDLERALGKALGGGASVFNAAQAGTGVAEASWLLEPIVAAKGCPRAVVVDVSAEGLNAASARLERGLEEYLPPSAWPAAALEVRRVAEVEAALVGLTRGWGNLLYAATRPASSAPGERHLALSCRGSVDGPYGMHCGRRTDRSMAERPKRQWKRLFAWQRSRLHDLHRLDRFRTGGLPERSLARIAEVASRCDAELFLLTLPSMVPYDEWGYGAAVATARLRAQELAAGSPSITWLDLSTPSPEPRDFMDPGHLTARASRGLTARLVPDLIRSLRPRQDGAPVPPAA